VGGGTDGWRMLAGIVTTMLPLIVRTGVADEAEIDVDTLGERLAAEMVGTLVVPPTLVGAWAVIGSPESLTCFMTTGLPVRVTLSMSPLLRWMIARSALICSVPWVMTTLPFRVESLSSSMTASVLSACTSIG